MNAFMYSEGTEPVMLLVGLVVLVSMVYWSYVQYVYCGTRIQSAIFLSLSTTLAERQMTHIAHYHLNEAAVLLLMLARRSRVKHYKGPCKQLILLLATVSHHSLLLLFITAIHCATTKKKQNFDQCGQFVLFVAFDFI